MHEQLAATETKVQAVASKSTVRRSRGVASAVQADNLSKIEGIGPKVARILTDSGILTFAQLAQTEVSRLRSILEEAGPSFKGMDPESWPEQAGLAAKGDWEALKKLQDELDGGRYKT
jgi:predicted flap endonuclease-1-like 5' DNA nuclease